MMPDAESLAGRARVHALRVEGVRCMWREWGSGPPVVLVHGGTGSWLHWVRNIAALSVSHRVLAPDMAGFGDSSDAPPGLGATGQARLLLGGLRQLVDVATPVAFVGFSFGAIVGGLAAAQADRPVRGLMLVGAVGLGIDRGPPLPMRAWKHLVEDPGAVDRAHRHNLATLMLARPESMDALALEVQRRNAAAARFYSKRSSHSAALAEALPRVPAPVAGIWGSEDDTAARDPARVSDRLHSLRPDASLDIIRGAGHWVQFEAAASFDAACLRWLATLSDAGGPR